MAKKRKGEDTTTGKPAKTEKGSSKKKAKRHHESDSDYSDADDHAIKLDHSVELDSSVMPPKDVLLKLLDRIETQLPKEDHVKYDSRAKKLDWEKIKFDELSGEDCQKYWYYIQERIRRFRILADLIPDARTWISQPWTNFYKSKDHNRHPDMPKKPLSMYMLYYSEKRQQILSENTSLSMPEVAKICSEQYQKLSDKKKAKYKLRCDEMRRVYDQRLRDFYTANPELKPIKHEKAKKSTSQTVSLHLPEPIYIQQLGQPMMQQQPQQMVVFSNNGQEQMFMMSPAPQQTQQQSRPMTSYPPASVMAQVQTQQQMIQQQPQQMIQQQPQQMMQQQPQQMMQQQPQQMIQQQQAPPGSFSSAPEKPSKPFDLFFRGQMENHAGEPNFDRQSAAERYRQEWKNMKLKKKARWIKKAADNFREYEEKVSAFCTKNPGYIKPLLKNFLTQEDQRILDKFMGRPEKPPSSAYSLFSKEMLNNVEIKKFPSKERMAQISEKWKILPQEQKDCYQGEVNRSMSVYRQKYEEWFNNLTTPEREAETSRLNSNKTSRKSAAKIKQEPKMVQMSQPQEQQIQHQHQPQQINLTDLTPVMVPGMTGIQMSQPISIVQAVPMHDPGTMVLPVLSNGINNERNILLQSILQREPQEPARSQKQLFVLEYLSKHKKKKANDAKEAWSKMDKKDKKKWLEKLEPQRQKYIDEYTQFVRGLDKEELEMYTELKQKRDEEEESRRQNDSSEDSDSETSDSETDSESDSESD